MIVWLRFDGTGAMIDWNFAFYMDSTINALILSEFFLYAWGIIFKIGVRVNFRTAPVFWHNRKKRSCRTTSVVGITFKVRYMSLLWLTYSRLWSDVNDEIRSVVVCRCTASVSRFQRHAIYEGWTEDIIGLWLNYYGKYVYVIWDIS